MVINQLSSTSSQALSHLLSSLEIQQTLAKEQKEVGLAIQEARKRGVEMDETILQAHHKLLSFLEQVIEIYLKL